MKYKAVLVFAPYANTLTYDENTGEFTFTYEENEPWENPFGRIFVKTDAEGSYLCADILKNFKLNVPENLTTNALAYLLMITLNYCDDSCFDNLMYPPDENFKLKYIDPTENPEGWLTELSNYFSGISEYKTWDTNQYDGYESLTGEGTFLAKLRGHVN